MNIKWKYFFAFLVVGIVVLASFFLWASSPQMASKDYETVVRYPEHVATKSDSVFSIVTYNIGYLSGMTNNKAVAKPKSLFSANLTKVKKLFKELQTDILALQEIDYNSARSYHINQQDELSTIGYPYAAQAINWDETYVPFPYWPPSVHFGAVLSGQSILSKYPLSNHKRIVLERVPDAPFYRNALYLERLAQIAQVEIGSKQLMVINIHLEAFDQATRARQFDAVIRLFDQYQKTHPTILLGDFNSRARDDSAAIQRLLNRQDIGNAAFDRQSISNTFSAADPFKRIDYIFYSTSNIEMIEGRVLTEFGAASDHLPVYMQFKLK